MNLGLLPSEYYALAEQHMGGYIADVLVLRAPLQFVPNAATNESGNVPTPNPSSPDSRAKAIEHVAVMDPPKTAVHESVEINVANLRRSIAIRHISTHRIVALIEIVSPANKDREESVEAIVQKTVQALAHGIHVLMIDILPTGKFDPQGLHECVRQTAAPYLPDRKAEATRTTLASYQSQPRRFEAFVEHPRLGEPLPSMAVFLDGGQFVYVPLEETYMKAWAGILAKCRDLPVTLACC